MERPILFSTPMVQAILKGHKTMTRRIIKPQPLVHNEVIQLPMLAGEYANRIKEYAKKGYTQIYTDGPLTGMIGPKCRFNIGDHLWVRESFMRYQPGRPYIYKADLSKDQLESGAFKFKPSIHMPKDATRIWLEVTEIKAERIQSISMHDAQWEGFPENGEPFKERLKNLWEKINGKDSWQDNPWVWAYTFKRINKPCQ